MGHMVGIFMSWFRTIAKTSIFLTRTLYFIPLLDFLIIFFITLTSTGIWLFLFSVIFVKKQCFSHTISKLLNEQKKPKQY